MATRKLTFLGHPAKKAINAFLRNVGVDRTSRRLAYADGIMAISGAEGVQLALQEYNVDLADGHLLERFNAMLRKYGYEQALERTADVCAEAHLWMTLTGLSTGYVHTGDAPSHRTRHPRHLHLWVYEIDRKNRVKEDSPCPNCRQWVRREFASANGTSKTVG